MEILKKTIERIVTEPVVIVPYDPKWPQMFQGERGHLLVCLPVELVGRIEHFGSTAVPGHASQPIIDMLVEVTSLEETRERVPPILEPQGYDYFWRQTWGDGQPPFFAWFIKRNASGSRTHHIHMVESHFEHWDRLLFRDYLIDHPDIAKEYEALKMALCATHERDRAAYTEAKTKFVVRVTEMAKQYYQEADHFLTID